MKIIVYLISMVIIVITANNCEEKRSELGFKLARHAYSSTVVSDFPACVQMCLDDAKCHSINFDLSSGNCDLNYASKSTVMHGDFVKASNTIFSDIGKPNHCSSNPCKNGGICLDLGWNNFECQCKAGFCGANCGKYTKPLGMENGMIPDSLISASSEWDRYHGPSNARLNFQETGQNQGAWSARTNNVNQWLKVDLGSATKVTAIETQGRQDCCDQWVTRYTVSYSEDNSNYVSYNKGQEFIGNTDRNSIVRHALSPPIVARYIRIHPTGWHNHVSMRVELHGCAAE